ncbi:hypothetical protein NSA50_00435 [Clostridium sp. DSM 100503]|uniref:hypothetical protein n=1 Tax=Clostridium sp. DSM 100503 TaxID=2963282 RepID=UPI0021499BA9|nr:hypothetical protein [Clostridium sp. DSM 100503]MCR1949520.1 hypothetical protein [Clostridium sp. DSM 100503]
MTITINFNTLLLTIIVIVSVIALIYFILALRKLIILIDTINNTLKDNKANLDNTIKNLNGISENVKDISDVAVETTAEAIIMKDGIVNQLDTIKDIINIIVGVFSKK